MAACRPAEEAVIDHVRSVVHCEHREIREMGANDPVVSAGAGDAEAGDRLTAGRGGVSQLKDAAGGAAAQGERCGHGETVVAIGDFQSAVLNPGGSNEGAGTSQPEITGA